MAILGEAARAKQISVREAALDVLQYGPKSAEIYLILEKCLAIEKSPSVLKRGIQLICTMLDNKQLLPKATALLIFVF